MQSNLTGKTQPRHAKGGAIVFGILLGFMVTLLASKSRAEEPSVSLGLRGWYSNWSYEPSSVGDLSIDPGLLVGPSAVVRLNKLAFGASYLFGTFDSVLSVPQGQFNVDFKRRDLDLYAAYRIQKYLNATLGYKRLSYASEVDDQHVGGFSANGIAGGLMFSRSFDNGLILSGTGNIMYLSYSIEEAFDQTSKTSGVGFNGEVNLGYRIAPGLPIPLLGYRVQGFGGDAHDTFSGLTLSVLYRL